MVFSQICKTNKSILVICILFKIRSNLLSKSWIQFPSKLANSLSKKLSNVVFHFRGLFPWATGVRGPGYLSWGYKIARTSVYDVGTTVFVVWKFGSCSIRAKWCAFPSEQVYSPNVIWPFNALDSSCQTLNGTTDRLDWITRRSRSHPRGSVAWSWTSSYLLHLPTFSSVSHRQTCANSCLY